MSAMQWWAQAGAYQEMLREEDDRRLPECWEVEYEQSLDDVDEEPADQYNREEECE